MKIWQNTIIQGNVLDVLKTMPKESVDCVITFLFKIKLLIWWIMCNFAPFMRTSKGQFIKGVSASPDTQFKKGQHWREPKPYWDKDYLYNEYVVKEKSSQDIAKEHNCLDTNIHYFLKKHKIKIRNTSEARKIKYWGQSGESNPMYNRKGELHPAWQGGITIERRELFSSKEWRKVSKMVRTRDNNTCQRCNKNTNVWTWIIFHIHHIVPFCIKELRLDVGNLVLLCAQCHRFVHSKKNINKEFILTYEQFNNDNREVGKVC
jgi:hypothetical protein